MPAVIVGLGEILWDLLPGGKQLGGAPANFAYHAKMLGLNHVNAYVYSAIGNDPLGTEILNKLDIQGINNNLLHISKNYKTGSVAVILDKQGLPNYDIEQNVAWDFIPETPKRILQTIDVVCFGTLAQRSPVSQQSINTVLSNLADEAVKIFDINLRQSFFNLNIIETSLKLATLFKINDDELKIISKLLNIPGNEEQQLETISQRYNLKLSILTKGCSGSLLYADGNISHHPGFKVNIKDTVGAGDAFTAAIAIGVLNGFELNSINDFANQIASYVCTTSGATPKLPAELVNLFHT